MQLLYLKLLQGHAKLRCKALTLNSGLLLPLPIRLAACTICNKDKCDSAMQVGVKCSSSTNVFRLIRKIVADELAVRR